MDSALILADRILQLIRASGANKVEAYGAPAAAHAVLPTLSDISFMADAVEPEIVPAD